MADAQDALIAWLAGDVKRLVRESRKSKKQFKDRPDTSSNDDEESADFIPMEKVSRAYVARKEANDKKTLNNEIDYSLGAKKRPEVKAAEEDDMTGPDSQMGGISETYVKAQNEILRAKEKQQIKDSITNKQRDESGKIVRPTKSGEEEKPEAAMDEVVAAYEKEQKKAADAKQRAQMKSTITGVPMPEPRETNPRVPSTQETDQPANLQDLNVGGTELALGEGQTVAQPQAVQQLKAFEPTNIVEPTPTAATPLSTLNIGADGAAQDVADKKPTDFSDLSSAFVDATSRDVSVLGMQVPKGGTAYDIAETSQRMLQSANGALPQIPMLARRLGSYLYKPLDAALGTHAFEAHNATTDQMQNYINGTGLVKEPQNFAERAAQALGAMAIPFPGASVANTAASPAKRMLLEMATPGTIIREGQSLAGTYAASAVGSVGINEGLYQTLHNIDKLRLANPPVPNSVGDVEPRVTSVPAVEAKTIQEKINKSVRSFIPNFAEASYSDVAITSVAALAAVALTVRGARSVMKATPGGKTIRDPANPTPDLTPPSATTANEVGRSLGQDASYVIESQARRAGDENLALDVSTQTRSGAKARIEYMHDTGAVELPGYQYQMSTSTKALTEHHLSRPAHEQADLDWAMATMDQVDHATVQGLRLNPNATGGPGMPAQVDVQRAQSILTRPENTGTVAAMNEMREAMLGIYQATGRHSPQTVSDLRAQRPNYAHIIETGDYEVVNGVTTPLTNMQRIMNGLNNKASTINNQPLDIVDDMASAQARTQVNGPNQRMSPVLSNVIALQQNIEFALAHDIKKRFIESVGTDPELGSSIKQLTGAQKPPHGTGLVEIWEGGKAKRYAVETSIAEALNFNPYATQRLLGTVKNITQSLTTGALAPWYGFTSATMEAGVGSITRLRGTRLGYIDQALQAASGGKLALPGDMLGTGAAMTVAAVNAVRSANILKTTQELEKALLADSTLQINQVAGALGGDRYVRQVARGIAVGHNTVVQDLVDNGKQIYAQSASATGNRIGALHSGANEMMRNVSEFSSKDIQNQFIRQLGGEQGNAIWQGVKRYLGAVSTVHDLTKLAYLEQNAGRMAENALARETRNLGGDLGKRGTGFGDSGYTLRDDTSLASRLALKTVANPIVGSGIDLARDSTRYINPHIQGVTRVMEAFRAQPASVMFGIVNGITLPTVAMYGLASQMGPEYVDYLLNKREEWRKTNYLYVPIPGKPPEEGMNVRIDPALSVFGYPVLEAMDSVFGIRKINAAQRNKEVIPQEVQGVASALSDGLKEFVGMGAPWPLEMAAAYAGVGVRNLGDPGFARQSEQATGAGGSGMHASSSLSLSTQMMLESILGVVGKAGIHAVDAMASADKKDGILGKLQAGGKQMAFDVSGQVPGSGFYSGAQPQNYTQSASALADNTRKDLSAARKVMKAIEIEQKELLNTKTNTDDSSMEMPNIRQGYLGEVEIPQDVRQQFDMVKQIAQSNGALGEYFTERRRISVGMAGLRAVNAGNIGRHVLVPIEDGAIGGLSYMIIQKDKLKSEAEKERLSITNPVLTPKTGVVASDRKQRPRPLEKKLGAIPDNDDIQAMRVPTLAEVSRLKNALNKRRYSLDLQAASTINELQKKQGVKLRDLAGKIKLNMNGKEVADSEDD